MPSRSSRSVRASEVPNNVSRGELLDSARKIIARPAHRRFFGSASSSSAETDQDALVSLAPQFGEQCGTITYPSTQCKEKSLKEKAKWRYDDLFDGITILHSGPSPELDICAIHGLNGNAFDTWTTGKVMWLRDLLPYTKPFGDSRIMIFGYNSRWADKKCLSGLSEWSNDLLDRICSVRTTDKEKQRPIIFICHSLGGLVARQAMIRLNAYPHLFPEIQLEKCAIIFLATPHLGSDQADWNKYLISLAELISGARADAIVNPLRSFNPISANANEDFANLSVQIPYECFYETEATKVASKNLHIVTKASATLNGKAAFPIANVDHRSICKYESKVCGGYRTVVGSLIRLNALLSTTDRTWASIKPVIESNPNGMPPLDARHYPLPPDTKWYEGKGLRTTDQLKNLQGRKQELHSLENLVAICRRDKASAIAVTGIGGIGKTEMLLEVAYQRLNKTNISFLRGSDETSLDDAYFHISRRLGHDILLENYRGKPTLDIWNNMSREEKIEKFRDWLKKPENEETLFILDDLDGLKKPEMILSAIPHEAKTILFSTRNPILREEIGRRTHHLHLPLMELDEVVQLMESVLERIGYETGSNTLDRATLRKIAVALHGHPLAAIIAIRYITRVIAQEGSESPERKFLNILTGSDFEARKRFLAYGLSRPSIMETFAISMNRLQDKNGKAWKLMKFVAVLETDEQIVDFRKFFYERACPVDPADFPDHDILAAKNTEISEAFAEFETVSFGERAHVASPVQFHPLWLECTLHAMGKEGRIRYISQVLIICHLTTRYGNASIVVLPHVKRCVQVCESFQIRLEELSLSGSALCWVVMERDLLLDHCFTAGYLHPPSVSNV